MFTRSLAGRSGRALSAWVVLGALNLAAWGSYGGGSGTPEDPYLIFTPEQLNAIGAQPQDWDKHFKLMADIDLGGYRETDFNRIGTPEDGPFTGASTAIIRPSPTSSGRPSGRGTWASLASWPARRPGS